MSRRRRRPTGTFTPGPAPACVAEDLDRVLEPGDDEVGWLAQHGRVPLGYLGDADKTATTFPVIDGVRYSVPGDRARHCADGTHRAARPRLGDHQLRRREDLRRGGRAGAGGAPGGVRRRRRRPPERAVGPGGRRRRGARRRRHGRRRRAARRRGDASPATSCPRRSCSGPTSCAAPPARPTTAGPASRRINCG